MMGSCFTASKTKDDHPPRCAPGDYPKNPAYANQPQQYMMPNAIPPGSNSGFITGQGGGNNGLVEGAAMGYMMGHGGVGMMSGIDGGPRMAIGGNYYGMT